MSRCLAVLVLILGTLAPAAAETPGGLLSGPWQFYPGAVVPPGDPRWAAHEVRGLTLPASWNAETWSGKAAGSPEGLGTYRLVTPLGPSGQAWSLVWTVAGTAARIWVNGQVAAEVGTLGPAGEVPANRPQVIGLGTGPTAEIVIAVSNRHHVDGGLWSPLRIGPTADLEAQTAADRAFDLLLAGALVLLGVIGALLGLVVRDLRAVFWFGAVCLVLGLRVLTHGHLSVYQLFPSLDWELFQKLRHATMYLGPASCLALIEALFPGSLRGWFLKASGLLALGGLVWVSLTDYRSFGDLVYPYTLVAGAQILFAAGVLWSRRRGALPHQLPVLAGIAVLLAGSTVEFLRVILFLPVPETLPAAALALTALMGWSVLLQQWALVGRVRELNATKDTMLSIISHDLRGPILSAGRYVRRHLLGVDLAGQDKQQALEVLADSLERSGSLLENLLSWSLSQSGRLTLTPGRWSARALAVEAADDLAKELTAKGHRLEVLPQTAEVWADRPTLVTVLRNLLSNAVKFTPPQGRITVAVALEGDEVRISVNDSGSGLDPDQLQRVLSATEKVVTSGTEGERGSGFGLFLCQEFLRRNGGRLEASSVPGEGSTFTAIVPRPA